MKKDYSDLNNMEFPDRMDADFEAIFESCKQDVSSLDSFDERMQLKQRPAAPAEPAPANRAEAAETEQPEKATPAPEESRPEKDSYRERIRRKQRMDATGKERKPASEKSRKKDLYDWMQTIVAAMVICILIFTFVVRIVGVVGRSMVPTLQNGDKLIVSNLGYTPERGDIVILRKASFMEDPIVKRVIAVAGEEVDINFERGIVYVNGLAQQEPYINERTLDRQDFDGPIIVPDNCVFVMGDNRNDSMDSRDIRLGCVDVRYIIGKVHYLIYPGVDQYGERSFDRIGSPYAD